MFFDDEATDDKFSDWLTLAFFEVSEFSTITKSDLASVLLGDKTLVAFSLLLLRSLRVRVVNGETISRNLEASTSMLMAERAACEKLADLPIYEPAIRSVKRVMRLDQRTYDERSSVRL